MQSSATIKLRTRVKSPKTFVSAFALAVTTEGSHCKDWIARKGKYSLQNTLERIIPQVIQSENEKNIRTVSKVTAAAFLKVIERKCGFHKVRIRRQGLDRESGNQVYCNRRWLRPSVSADRALLERNYEAVCFSFPSFAQCSLETFLEVLEDVGMSWEAALTKIRSRTPDASFCSPSISPEQGSSLAPSVFGSIVPKSVHGSQLSSFKVAHHSPSAMDLSNLLNHDDCDPNGSHTTPNFPATDAPSRNQSSSTESPSEPCFLLDATPAPPMRRRLPLLTSLPGPRCCPSSPRRSSPRACTSPSASPRPAFYGPMGFRAVQSSPTTTFSPLDGRSGVFWCAAVRPLVRLGEGPV
eukprot:CAMPEP_0113686054 /NCGR_PEP_ID=MMETSP0038_2-20120614/15056_1 /TAXON_ID=2898 /ORGANISM="Cryptomonas paramecium" /LENGTH=352 /DNA_ID=CAMNT_0000606293 /DNA_START=62 /DNA_END=1120 /DNA_ORIENTATION=- /assembly_acc=CAM_ASM_000170